MSTANNDFAYVVPRGLPRLRQKISRLLRGKRGHKNRKAPAISKAPPRLGPIGNVKAVDPDSFSDLVSINFDNGSFEKLKLSFDVGDASFFGAKENKTQRAGTTIQPAKTTVSSKPQTQTTITSTKRTPLVPQSTNGKVREPTTRLPPNVALTTPKPAFEPAKASPLKIWSTQSISVESTTASATKGQSAKRKADDYNNFSVPKMRSTEQRRLSAAERTSMEHRPVVSNTRRSIIHSTELIPLASVEQKAAAPKNRPVSMISLAEAKPQLQEAESSASSTTLQRNLSLDRASSVKRESLRDSSRYSGTSTVEAQKVEYKKPTYGPKIVDSESTSLASRENTPKTTPTLPSKRFEVKTDSLLKPVTSNDKTARKVSETIGRINSNAIGTSVPALDVVDSRPVTDRGRPIQSSDEIKANRRLSQPAGRSNQLETRSPTPDYTPQPRERRASSRLSDRMSWLKDLEESSKNPGRDFVFKKLEGGVAAKLAQLEGKKMEAKPAPGGVSRSNSTVSRASDMYSIEAGSSRLTRRGTLEGESRPGNISDVVDGSFKQKLESVAGNLAQRVQKASSSDLNGLGIRGGAARGVPQDVLDMIALSGVDQEAAINEYLQQNKLGKTKTWDQDEVAKEINAASSHALFSDKKDTSSSSASVQQPVPAAKEIISKNEASTAGEERTDTSSKAAATSSKAIQKEPSTKETKDVTETEKSVNEPESVPSAEVKTNGLPTPSKSNDTVLLPSQPTVQPSTPSAMAIPEPTVSDQSSKLATSDKSGFNPAALPSF